MKSLLWVLVAILIVAGPLPVKADMVLDWNTITLNAIRTGSTSPPVASRALAITHAAIFDSVNSISTQYTPYKYLEPGYSGASREAAVAQAGYTALTALFPGQNFSAQLAASLSSIPNGTAKDKGIELGALVASKLVTLRATDGWNAVYPYTPTNPPVPGHWQPTPPANAPFLLPQWGFVTPFTMTSNTQFKQEPPPALDTTRYTDEFNEVKDYGAKISPSRTVDQTNIAYFWADGPGTETPPGHWNSIAQTVAQSENNTLAENARLFALLNLAEADAAIASWYMKLDYDFWRPITGIREADTDGNPNTIDDPAWEPLLNTPAFPTYVSGHSTFSGAAAAVLADLFGDATAFTSTTDSLVLPPDYERYYTSFSQAALEAGKSRIYGGIHWQCDNEFGLKAGDELGNYIFANYLSPVPLPGTLVLSLTGLGAMLLGAWRRRR